MESSGRRREKNRPMGGLVLVIIGLLLLGRQMDLGVPHWMFSWEMILISIGVFIGARRSFQPGGWLVMVFIGAVFLIQDEFFDISMRHYVWPIMIIGIGLFMIIRPRKRSWDSYNTTSSEDFTDSSVAFGGVKKKIITKSFSGARIENIFGGTDIDMMQADFKGTVVMDFNVAFGGVKLVVPPHWNVKNEITAILGGIDDKRPMVQNEDPGKVLVLKGTVLFGGIDIKSY